MSHFSETERPGWYSYRETIKKVRIEYGMRTIGSYAFVGLTTLEKVELTTDLVLIGINAFEGCDSLQDITIPDGVEVIEQ